MNQALYKVKDTSYRCYRYIELNSVVEDMVEKQ